MSNPQFNKAREALAIKQKSAKSDLEKRNLKDKKAAKSGNKAQQKEVNKKCSKLVEDLKIKHKLQVEELEGEFKVGVDKNGHENETDGDDNFECSETASTGESEREHKGKFISEKSQNQAASPEESPLVKKLSKAAKNRLKKAQQEKELAERIQQAKTESNKNVGKDPSYLESFYLKKYIEELGLTQIEIKADGSCLFNAILKSAEFPLTNHTSDSLRSLVANHLKLNQSTYSGFIEEESFETYLKKLNNGTLWGGHLEISVISKLFKMSINVVQYNSPVGGNLGSIGSCTCQKFDAFEGTIKDNSCVILFYQHLMQSAHYNGTRRRGSQ